MRTLIAMLACSLTLGTAAVAEVRPDVLVREDFFAAVMLNDQDRLEAGMKKAEEFLEKDPNNARMIVWQGAGQFFNANFAFRKNDFKTGQALQQQGLARMQQAVDLAPNDPAVLVARGAALINSSRFMPPQMGRPLAAIGVADYEKTIQVQKPVFDKLSTHSKGELLLGLADGSIRLDQLDKAQAYFTTMSTDPTLKGTVYERKALAWLEGKEESKTQGFFQCSGCHKTAAE